MSEKEESEANLPNLIMPDTNVLIHDPHAIDFLREGGNVVKIASQVIFELDNLKNKPDIGFDARLALKKIEELRRRGDKSLVIEHNVKFGKYLVDHEKGDNRILAAFNFVVSNFPKGSYKDFSKLKFISNDLTLRLLAMDLFRDNPKVVVEEYQHDRIKVEIKSETPLRLKVPFSKVSSDGLYFSFSKSTNRKKFNGLKENEGVICSSDYDPYTKLQKEEYKDRFAALYQGGRFRIINPQISASGIKSLTNNGNGPNWQQQIALAQLLDPNISCCFLSGGAGTGKTILAIAASLEQASKFRQTLITRPMVHLGDEDNMGFLPGDISNKMSPWMIPIEQNLRVILSGSQHFKDETPPLVVPENGKTGKKKRSKAEKVVETAKTGTQVDIFALNNIMILPLDFIRGITLLNSFIVIDEAQNLTPHQVKTIITRVGLRSKIVFTGDLGQIDSKKIPDFRSSGLAYASYKLNGNPMVSVVNFSETVRSPLAALAEKAL